VKKNTEYIIPYEGLKQGMHSFEFEITDKFFESFETERNFHDVNIRMNVNLMKDITMLIFDFKHDGTSRVTCDRCLAEIPQPIKASNKLIVKFGDNKEDDNESIVTFAQGEYEIDLAPFIYDYICLSFPWKFDCSGMEESDKRCDWEVLQKIDLLQADNSENKEEDPRWEALKKLK
jgi:uncharacterized metal-binding protein YceD (DUF177 family)